ncbi:hypothetical protein ACVRC1_004482 [Salmonella enterica subsp. enterica serovar Newport]
MEYVPNDIKDVWRTAFATFASLKNKQVKNAIGELHNGVSSADEAGKLSVYKEMKKHLIISFPAKKAHESEANSFYTFMVGKPNCEVSKEERENAIVFLSSTGKLMKLNQLILQKLFDVSQSTIAKDISSLKEEGRICPDFIPVKRQELRPDLP